MKRTLLLLTAATGLIFSNAAAQTIPNNSFENWTSMGSYDEPNNWGTFNGLSAVGYPVTTVKSTDAQAGSFAISVTTMASPSTGDTIPGMAWLGSFANFSFSDGIPFTQKPGALTGMYKYTRMGSDTGVVYAYLSKWNTSTNTRDYIAEGSVAFITSNTTYAAFTAPLVYTNMTLTPDTMGIWIIASGGNVATPGSALKVDNLSFTGVAGAGITSINADQKVKTYPNPASQNVSFAIYDNSAASIEIFDMSGRRVQTVDVTSNVMNIDLNGYTAGLYMYQVTAENGALIERGKLSVSK
jgi:hypothetical protein